MISSILTGISVSLFLSMMYRASQGNAKEDENGNLVLRLPKFYWILGAISFLIGIGLLVVAYFYVDSIDDSHIVLYMSLAFIFLGYFLFSKGFISNILVTENELIETGLFGKKTIIYLNEINTISFGNISQELRIKTQDSKIKAHFHLIGFSKLVSILERKTGISRKEMGL